MESLNGGNGHSRQSINATIGTPLANPIGEVVDTSVADFIAQACQLNVAPPFGGFVKVLAPERTIYAVVPTAVEGTPVVRSVLQTLRTCAATPTS